MPVVTTRMLFLKPVKKVSSPPLSPSVRSLTYFFDWKLLIIITKLWHPIPYWAVTLTFEVDLPRVRPTDSLAVPELDMTCVGECFVD